MSYPSRQRHRRRRGNFGQLEAVDLVTRQPAVDRPPARLHDQFGASAPPRGLVFAGSSDRRFPRL